MICSKYIACNMHDKADLFKKEKTISDKISNNIVLYFFTCFVLYLNKSKISFHSFSYFAYINVFIIVDLTMCQPDLYLH